MPDSSPMVTIWCPTYNHERFISKAIDSFLMQRTNFNYEIVVHDDASNDKTPAIVKEYADKYQQLIKPIFQSQNKLSNEPDFLHRKMIEVSRGKYIALCEGDDYWTDETKLQRQVDYLEKNPQVSIILHNGIIIENDMIVREMYNNAFRIYNTKDVIRKRVLAPTASYCLRNQVQVPNWIGEVYGKDSALLFILSHLGQIHYWPEVMCAYRRNPNSMEGKYNRMPLEKAMRDINEYKVYLNLVSDVDKLVILRKIIWCFFYRIVKGIRMGRIKSIPLDSFYLLKYSFEFLRKKLSSASKESSSTKLDYKL